MDYERFYNRMTKKREALLVNILACSDQELIQLGEGKVSPRVSPFEEISVRLKDGRKYILNDSEMKEALGLGRAQGCTPLLKKLKEMQKRYHAPPRNDWDILMTTGAQDGLTRSFEAFVDLGDPIMVQVPLYFGVAGVIAPLEPEFIGINQDADGIIPEEIINVCENRLSTGKPMPKLLYVNPTGANPTGSVLPESRRRQIYALAQKYDFLIIEDDAYYFLHFLDKLPTSFFSLDTDGRVIRLDTFSKVMSAGLRLGVVTAHKDLVNKMIIHVENTILHTSSLSQMVLYKLFDTWGLKRFEQHFNEIREFYKEKRDMMLKAVERYFTGIAEWSIPQGGMFVWVKITAFDNMLDLVLDKCVSNGVFVLPGNAFNYDAKKVDRHLRLCYSYASEEEIHKGLSTVARLIREEAAKKMNGVTNGISNGVSNGKANGVTNGISNGVSNGITNGLANGMKNGITNGMANGMKNGITNLMTNGIKNGISDGAMNNDTEGIDM